MAHILDEQVGEIYGWRSWTLERDAADLPILRSPYRPTTWHGPVLVADQTPALTEREVSPPKPRQKTADDTGGLFTSAFLDMLANTHRGENGVHAWREHTKMTTQPFSVVGAVALSGTVIEGEHGYRAERAAVAALWLVWPTWTQLTVRGARPDGYKRWRDTLPMDVLNVLADRYQCPVELYRAHLLEGWTP